MSKTSELMTDDGRPLSVRMSGSGRRSWHLSDGTRWTGTMFVITYDDRGLAGHPSVPIRRVGRRDSSTTSYFWPGKPTCSGRHRSREGALACIRRALPEHERFAEIEQRRLAIADIPKAKERARRRTEALGPGWQRISKQVLAEEPQCRACGKPAIEVDHIVPVSRGGTSERANLQPLCTACHRAKTDALYEPYRHEKEARTPPPGMDIVRLVEVAQRLGVQYATARRWVSKSRFPPVEVIPGKAPEEWWRWSVVEEWAQQTGRLDRPDSPVCH